MATSLPLCLPGYTLPFAACSGLAELALRLMAQGKGVLLRAYLIPCPLRQDGTSTIKGGNPNGDSNGSVGIERQDWTDKTTDQRKMGGQRFGENFPDDQSFDGRS